MDLLNNIEIKFNNPDDFYIIFELNSNKLKLYNINGNLKGSNKDILINIKSNDKIIINGNAKYNVKMEKNKNIIEGRGDIQYYNDKKSISFQLTKQIYNNDNNNNNELGFEYKFDGQYGNKNLISTLKLTNKNFIIELAGCEKSKQCTNFKIQSLITYDNNDYTNMIHDLQILINLIELGYPYEFDLQSKNIKSGLKLNHDIEVTIKSNLNKQYKLNCNIKPNSNLIELILPKRHISFETYNKIPDGIFGKYDNTIIFYIDKLNKPNDKLLLSSIIDITNLKNSELLNSNAEFKLVTPYINKPLLIKCNAIFDLKTKNGNANMNLDIFKSEDSKIIGDVNIQNNLNNNNREFNHITEVKFYSQGLNFNYNMKSNIKFDYDHNNYIIELLTDGGGNDMKSALKLKYNDDKLDTELKILNQQLYNMKGIYDRTKNLIKTDSTYQVIGSKPIKLITELSSAKMKVVLKRDGLLQAVGEFNPGKEASLRLNKGNDKNSIYSAILSLDPATFFATQYDVNKDELNNFMKFAKDELEKDIDAAKQKLNDKFTKVSNGVQERLKKAKENFPDTTKLINNYQNNIKSIVNELEDDPELQKLFIELRTIYKKISAILEELSIKTKELYDKIEIAFFEFYEKQLKLYNDTILPAIKDLYIKLIDIFNEFYKELQTIFEHIYIRAIKAWKNFENDIKELSKPIIELLKPLNEFINELINLISKEWKELWEDIKEYFNKLPTFIKELTDKLNEQLIKLRNVDDIISILRDIFLQLDTYTTSQEIKDFLNKLLNYIERKLLNENINDIDELEKLYYSLIQAINSIILQLTGGDTNGTGTGNSYLIGSTTSNINSFYNIIIQPLTYGIEKLSKLPSIFTFKLSPFNYIKNEEFNSFNNLINIYNIPSIIDILPPYQLNGHITNGENIFTFDGRYIYFPGQCKYILAQDSIDNNFTIIGNINNNKLESIILLDKTHNYIEINNNGILKMNDKKIEYPIHDIENGIHIWRRYYTLSILSSYGVLLKCTLDLNVCHININGFYTGKIRGLFGNGNSEPYDDYLIQNGQILENSYDFSNSYKLNQNCPIIPKQNELTTSLQQQQNEPICNDIFDYDSTLLFGYLFMDKKPYLDACNHIVKLKSNDNDKENIACNIALTYASGLRLYYNIPIEIPKRCTKCQSTSLNNLLNIDDEINVKIPKNKVDVVLVVDTSLSNDILNDLVQEILLKLRNDLKQRNLNDINISVIGYNKKQKYPNLLTTNGKLNYNGKLLESTLDGPKYDDFTNIGINKLNEILEKLNEIHTPIASDLKAIELALDYPFRPDAAKSILLIRDNQTAIKTLDILSAPVLNYLFKTRGVSVNYIGPVDNLMVDGKPNDKVVGFNKRVLVMLGGFNKRQKLDYSNDPLIDILVNDDSTVFSLEHFKQLKTPEQKKQYTDQVSTMISDQLLKTEITSNCVCSLKYGLHGETQCTKQTYEFVQTSKKNIPQKQG